MRRLVRWEPSVRVADTPGLSDETTMRVTERTLMMSVQTVARNEDFLASVIVPRISSTRDITVLETAMQGLALDDRHPVALELAATASSRHFLLRATSALSLKHLADQMQARYPQAIIRPLAQEDDPLVRRVGEAVSAVELRAGASAYLPLRAFRERELLQEGADPLLGILGVFNHLPSHMRVVTQLALIPASPTWSRNYRRKSVEHPLEQERLRARREFSTLQANGPGTLQLVGMGVLVALLLIWWRFKRQLDALIPSWLLQAGLSLLHGKTPQLTSAQLATLEIGGVVSLISLFCLAFVILQVKNRLGTSPMYDMLLVDAKTARPAYRVRLRLFVFSTEAEAILAHHTRPSELLLQRFSRQTSSSSSLSDTYQNWQETARHHKQHRQEQRDVLDHLMAAYRQYHTASGGYFTLQRLSQAKLRACLRRAEGGCLRVAQGGHLICGGQHICSA
jgi:hypothetical protein